MRTPGSLLLLLLSLTVPAFGSDFFRFAPRELNVYYSDGRTPMTNRGHAVFHTATIELTAKSAFLDRHLRNSEAGVSLSYSDITQARSWFGYRYGDPNDRVRGENAYFFARHYWRAGSSLQPYVELGTGPMWSNRRVPAATSRFNMNSQGGAGVVFFAGGHPLHVGYRFSHISDGGVTGRNPGWDLHSFVIGTRIHSFLR